MSSIVPRALLCGCAGSALAASSFSGRTANDTACPGKPVMPWPMWIGASNAGVFRVT